jgi:hypothetical protein
MPTIISLRKRFQRRVCHESIFLKSGHIPSIADVGSKLSAEVSTAIIKTLGYPVSTQSIEGQTAGKNFESITMEFIKSSINALCHLRPVK